MTIITDTPNPLDGIAPEALANAVRILRPANPYVLTPESVTLDGEYGPVTIMSDRDSHIVPGSVGVTVEQLYRLHSFAGEGWRFGPKGCPFC